MVFRFRVPEWVPPSPWPVPTDLRPPDLQLPPQQPQIILQRTQRTFFNQRGDPELFRHLIRWLPQLVNKNPVRWLRTREGGHVRPAQLQRGFRPRGVQQVQELRPPLHVEEPRAKEETGQPEPAVRRDLEVGGDSGVGQQDPPPTHHIHQEPRLQHRRGGEQQTTRTRSFLAYTGRLFISFWNNQKKWRFLINYKPSSTIDNHYCLNHV